MENAITIMIALMMAIFRGKHFSGANLIAEEDARNSIITNEQAFIEAIFICLKTLLDGTNAEVLKQFSIKAFFEYNKNPHAVNTADEKLAMLKQLVAILRKIIIDHNALTIRGMMVNAGTQIGIPSDFEILRVFMIVFHMVEMQLSTPTELACTPFYTNIALAPSSSPSVKVSGCTKCPMGTCSGCSSSSSSF
jgi:hypothetical protein